MQCPREAYYYKCLERESNDVFLGRRYGRFLHKYMMEPHYHPAIENATDVLNANFEEFAKIAPEDDYRTLDYTQKLYALYRETYEHEPFDVLTVGGKPAIELPFAIHICDIDYPDHGRVPVIYTGRIDLIGRRHSDGEYFVLDHKSSKIGGSTFWEQWRNSTQLFGYCYAAQQLAGLFITSYTVNALFVRPPSRTGKMHELLRQSYGIGDDDASRLAAYNAWHSNLIDHITQLEWSINQNNWPMCTNACVRRYGVCEYLDTCRFAPGREHLIDSNLYIPVTWDPLNPDE